MPLRLTAAVTLIVLFTATTWAQSTTSPTSRTSPNAAQAASSSPQSSTPVPPATAPAATTSSPPVSAPNAVVQPVPRPVVPPTSNTPQPPSTAVNPLAPTAQTSNAAQTVIDSTTSTPGAINATTLAVEPTTLNELAAAGVDVSLNPTAALSTLRQAPVANQQTALRSMQTRIDATSRALIDLRAQARANGVAGAGANFDSAAEEVRVREIALRDAISTAGGTTDEAGWRQSQTQLATLYQAYADAVQRARALLQPTPQP
jgi:hypothetical protein